MSLFAGEGAQEEGDNGAGRSHRRGWERRERGGSPPCQPGQKTRRDGETRCFVFGPGIKVVHVHSRKHGKHGKHRKRRKGRLGASHCPASSKGHRAAGKWSLLRALARAVWPEPTTKDHSQSGLIRQRSQCRARSLGDRRAHSGPAHNRALVGGGGRVLREPLIPRQERASLLPYNPGDGRQETERLIWEDKETLPLTVDGLFLEMGRLFSIAAVSMPPALPTSVPSNVA